MKEQLLKAIQDALEKGWSVKSLADAIEIDHGILYRFLAGQRTPNLETAGRIADFLGMKLTPPKIPPANKG